MKNIFSIKLLSNVKLKQIFPVQFRALSSASQQLYKRNAESPYIITRVTPISYVAILDLMWQCYHPDEPCTKSLGLGTDRNAHFDRRALDSLCKGYCLQAHCKSTGQLVGGSINTVMSPSYPEETERAARILSDKRMRELDMFWAYVARKSDLWQKYSVNEIFEVINVFVRRDCRKSGLAKKLSEASLNLGLASGFALVKGEATNIYEQRICEELNMVMQCSIPFSSYMGEDNVPVFNPQPPHNIVKTYVYGPAVRK